MKRLLSFAILTLALTVIAQAQYTPSGPPASVTSVQPAAPGSARATAGPTVTSGSFSPRFVPGVRTPHHNGNGHHSGGNGNGRGQGRFGTPFAPDWAYSPGFIAVPVPVPVDADGNPIQGGDAEERAQTADDEAPAYTVFEHRNRNAFPIDDYSDMRRVARPRAMESTSEATAPSVPDQPATVLVFRDGHQIEITNYAIQSGTLFNMSESGPRKIALADLDVDKTVKANDERGVDFTVPIAR